jgi:hypothetical protein
MPDETPERQLRTFMDKYTPEIGVLARAVRAKMRARLPGAIELVYDNYNALVIVYGPTEHASDAVFSIALYPRWVTLFFAQGASLRDPHHVLKGTGVQVRHVVLTDAADLDIPKIHELMEQALAASPTPMPAAEGRLVIKSISAKQRPRRPGK